VTTETRQTMARRAAEMLLDIEAVHFNADELYTFTSGLRSPVYIDCRKIISFPAVRSALNAMAVEVIGESVGPVDTVAGGETAGIPFAAFIADRLDKPMLYVRKKPKGFGRNARIEGFLQEGQRALLVEDLASEGGSKVGFVQALREAGATVEHCFVVFFYDIFPGSRERLSEIGIELHYLTTWWDVLAAARARAHFEPRVLDEVERFLKGPLEWSAARGGVGAAGGAGAA
jgi:orotate phosphoribosyltransferase